MDIRCPNVNALQNLLFLAYNFIISLKYADGNC